MTILCILYLKYTIYFPILIDVPEFVVHSKVQNVVFTEVFTFNCTPSAVNPPPISYVFERDGVKITEGVSGSILTVSSLKRSEDSGKYTCNVTNEAGSVTIATYLNIVGELIEVMYIEITM